MNAVVAVQARMGSKRLPGKVLADLCGKPMLERVLEAVAGPWQTVVLTSFSRTDDPLVAWLKEKGVQYRRGLLEDVLSRYADLAMELRPDRLVRVCGDAPFLKAEWIAESVWAKGPTFKPGALHCGAWETWLEANESTEPPDWHHAGYYWFEKHAEHQRPVPSGYMTVNTPEDLEEARRRLAAP